MTKTYRSEIAATVHEVAEGLYEGGVINKITMREFDESCLVPTPDLVPDDIKNFCES